MGQITKSIMNIKKRLLVKDIMTREVFSLKPKDTILKAAKLMTDKNISTVVVLDSGKLVGILTEKDMVSRILCANRDPSSTKLDEVMTKSPKIIGPGSPILTAASEMKRQKVRKLLVIGDSGRIEGIISQTDIVNSMKEIDDNYRKLLGNPYLTVIILSVIVLLYILNVIIFSK